VAGSQFGLSNAADPSELSGKASDFSLSGAAGYGFGVDASGNTGSNIWQLNVTGGIGGGGRGSAGQVTDTTVIPFCHM
jgi:hypothetical protein